MSQPASYPKGQPAGGASKGKLKLDKFDHLIAGRDPCWGELTRVANNWGVTQLQQGRRNKMKGLFTQEQYIGILRSRERLRTYKDKVVRYPAEPERSLTQRTLGACYNSELGSEHSEVSPLSPRTVHEPSQDYFLLGRIAYMQRELDSLKKGYHTHKDKQRDIV